MKHKIPILTTLTTGLCVSPAAALNITPWYAESGEYTRFWFDWGEGIFAPLGFLNSITIPYTDIVGPFFFVLLWGVYLFGVWNRSMSVELVAIAMLIFAPLWGMLLPPETFPLGMICLAIGIAKIIYDIYKRRG